MKNKVICFFLIITTVLLCSCQNKTEAETKQDELYNYEVTEEPFEKMQIHYSLATFETHATEEELFEAAEMVFVGMPLDTFTDGDLRYFDRNANEVKKDSNEIFSYMTVRNIKVIEMIKGDSTLETVAVADEAGIKEFEDGSKAIVGLPSTSFIAKKNVKYVYYLMPALPEDMDFYFCMYDGGLVNIDGLDKKVDSNNWKLSETKARLESQFKKYDRSKELLEK